MKPTRTTSAAESEARAEARQLQAETDYRREVLNEGEYPPLPDLDRCPFCGVANNGACRCDLEF